MKKLLTILLAVSLFFVFIGITSAAQEKAKQPLPQKQPLRRPTAPAFNVVPGSITKINTADPAKPTIEVKNDKDNTMHVIEITPFTNIAKMTDISELKAGDEVRVMTRKVENKEVAVNVVFGKIKNMPAAPRPPMQGRVPAPIAQKAVKK